MRILEKKHEVKPEKKTKNQATTGGEKVQEKNAEENWSAVQGREERKKNKKFKRKS